jgi:hypothetical protein
MEYSYCTVHTLVLENEFLALIKSCIGFNAVASRGRKILFHTPFSFAGGGGYAKF